MSVRLKGTVKWFDTTKGFGFILVDDYKGDVLLHANVLRNFGRGSVVEGSTVEVEVQDTEKGRQVSIIHSLNAPSEPKEALEDSEEFGIPDVFFGNTVFGVFDETVVPSVVDGFVILTAVAHGCNFPFFNFGQANMLFFPPVDVLPSPSNLASSVNFSAVSNRPFATKCCRITRKSSFFSKDTFERLITFARSIFCIADSVASNKRDLPEIKLIIALL